jgi:glycosidase
MRTNRLRHNELEQQGASPFYVVGETIGGEDGHDLIMAYTADYELHGQFDFPLLYPIRSTFAHDAPFTYLEDRIRISENRYGSSYMWHSPFLGNHDIPRFVTEMLGNSEGPFGNTADLMAQGPASEITQWNIINRMSMGYAFLLTIPGIPLLYYGDEIGLAGGPDPDNRRMMFWDWNANQRELLGRVQNLGQARRDLEPLRRGTRQELWIDDNFYVYARVSGPGRVVIVAMNKGGESRTETVTIPGALGIDGRRLRSYTSERSINVAGGAVQVTLDSWEYAVFYLD